MYLYNSATHENLIHTIVHTPTEMLHSGFCVQQRNFILA